MQTKDDEWLSSDDFVRLQRGDGAVFRRVYEKYVGLVQYVLRRCGVDAASADDIVQEAFLRLFRRAAEIQQPAAIKAWLVTTARNIALDERRKRRHLVATDRDDVAEEADASVESARRELEISLVGALVQDIVRETGDSTLSDFYVLGRSAKEIAAEKGEAISTVTTRLSRVRQRFQERLRARIQLLRDGLP
jgi:RNA polymerase sigma-70 factor (ECF subfamily)